jgi:hypothetical protein
MKNDDRWEETKAGMMPPMRTSVKLRGRRGLLKAATVLVGGLLVAGGNSSEGITAQAELDSGCSGNAARQPRVRPPDLSVPRRK